MTDPIAVLEEHFGEVELLVCAWPGCENGAWRRDPEGHRWCDQLHFDLEGLFPLATTSRHGHCAWCEGLTVAHYEEGGVHLHPRCVRHWALAQLPQNRARGAYGRRRG